jgi:hypothetical protein
LNLRELPRAMSCSKVRKQNLRFSEVR